MTIDLFKAFDTDDECKLQVQRIVLAVAASDAAFDGRGELSALSKADRNRYIERAMNSTEVVLKSITDLRNGAA